MTRWMGERRAIFFGSSPAFGGCLFGVGGGRGQMCLDSRRLGWPGRKGF